MGYYIGIGECIPNPDYPELSDVVEITCPAAPPLGSSEVDYANHIDPSYSGWSGFCEKLKIEAPVFGKQDGLLREHPGCATVTQRHVDAVQAAFDQYTELHPNREDADVTYNKAEWLLFWLKHALEFCKHPVFVNR